MIESLGFIQDILHHLNYFWVTVLMAIESSFIPFPSEVVVPPAAYKAATGEMNIFLVVLFATLGSDKARSSTTIWRAISAVRSCISSPTPASVASAC